MKQKDFFDSDGFDIKTRYANKNRYWNCKKIEIQIINPTRYIKTYRYKF